MFVAREKELRALNRMYEAPGFQMCVIYGRRRVGKTSLIDEFVHGRRTLYFTAQQKTSAQNLALFGQAIATAYGLPVVSGLFPTWDAALDYIVQREGLHASGDPLVFVFDEFPYAAESEPSLPSALQVAIDHGFKQTKVRMILCGSNEGFMEGDVLGSKSPLYGRRTMQIHLQPFDYHDAARMLPGLDPIDQVTYYATFGGTPYYLAQVDGTASYEQNISRLVFDTMGLLYEEPLMLLRQELREPAQYNSILDAIGNGSGTPSRIAGHAGINQNSVGKYLRTLSQLGIITKEAPFGENLKSSRNARYRFADPFFAFWYRFVSTNMGAIEQGAGEAVATQVARGQGLPTYVGGQFERVCLQWLARENAAGHLPFLATEFGRWWGTDPSAREQVDIDAIAASKAERSLLVGECKWRNSFDETEALSALAHRATLLGGFSHTHYVLFSKQPASAGSQMKAAQQSDLRLVSAEDLYQGI